MSVKTLNTVQAVAQTNISQARTYSIGPSLTSVPVQTSSPSTAGIELFLEEENPLGCIRGVMWVMAFNMAVTLLGVIVWQTCKFLL
jgi:hypothetical protein